MHFSRNTVMVSRPECAVLPGHTLSLLHGKSAFMKKIYLLCALLSAFTFQAFGATPHRPLSAGNGRSGQVAVLGHEAPEAAPQKKEVRGTVTDSTGAPLPGVTVYVKNDKSIGTTTDLNGKYILDV